MNVELDTVGLTRGAELCRIPFWCWSDVSNNRDIEDKAVFDEPRHDLPASFNSGIELSIKSLKSS